MATEELMDELEKQDQDDLDAGQEQLEQNQADPTGQSGEQSSEQAGQGEDPEAKIRGLLAELQATRAARQQERLEKEQALAALAQYQQGQQQAKTDEQQEDLTDEDLPTVGQVKRLLDQQMSKVLEETQKARIRQSLQQARQRFSETRAGKGLDFDTVMREGLANIPPEIRQAIDRLPDPASEAYRQAILYTPSLQQRQQQLRNAQMVNKLNKRGGGMPKGGGGSMLADQLQSERMDPQFARYLSMSDEELERELAADAEE